MPRWQPREAKKEAARRVKARRSRFRKSETLQQRIAEEASASKSITRLVEWASKKGYKVTFGPKKRDYIFYKLRRITICSRPSLMSQLVALLHECGHLLLNADESYSRRFGRGWPAAEREAKAEMKTATHRVQLFEEEVEAWNRGERLGRRLRLPVTRTLWNQCRFTCLRHYARYAAQ